MAERPAESVFDDPVRFGRVLVVIGIIGMVGALVVGIAGWILASKASDALLETVTPIAGVVTDVAATIEASQVMVDRTVEAIESIEDATRSTARTLDSVGAIVGETAELAGGGLADSLDAAIDTLPALIDTGRVVDRTMRALSLVGVDYDPEVPLDEALGELESSLAPIPGQLREQVDLLLTVQEDLARIGDDAATLSAVLLETRIDMMEAGATLDSAAEHATQAAEQISSIAANLETYDMLARVVVVAAALALAAAASAPLLIGIHHIRRVEAV
ncbi:MAG TPA: hypothetical protein VI141_04340 [Acidimicrobiia bacterium]